MAAAVALGCAQRTRSWIRTPVRNLFNGSCVAFICLGVIRGQRTRHLYARIHVLSEAQNHQRSWRLTRLRPSCRGVCQLQCQVMVRLPTKANAKIDPRSIYIQLRRWKTRERETHSESRMRPGLSAHISSGDWIRYVNGFLDGSQFILQERQDARIATTSWITGPLPQRASGKPSTPQLDLEDSMPAPELAPRQVSMVSQAFRGHGNLVHHGRYICWAPALLSSIACVT
ncbi:uncharacterized protein MYCFIDRAFT_207971 [Pseudocercospora fijiensis CIRAD86]|uniref:Uncharacterized protein n=1 Tax=Pseudocercospora fijiensis (strain CIRAD86) TaxID=383855 RepID=M3AWN4_PSEFD|nr:uncharacterized protein MYCFIDRAFT_207971 [Pseudocercospora fijiensis CIRAD86]EME81872.1 hypothetical protein MYCFIDRAFT_207971 [Pseudocercospora fijiensis CIRAD86]